MMFRLISLVLTSVLISLSLWAIEPQKLEDFVQKYPNNPNNSEFILTLADAYFDSNLSKSIDYSKLFIQKYPESSQLDAAYYLLGLAYGYDDQEELAQKNFLYFVQHFPQSIYLEEVRFRLAEFYFDQQDYPQAELYYGQILSNPKSIFYLKAFYKSAWVAYLLHDYAKSIEQFTHFLNIDSGNSDLLKQEAARYLANSFVDGSIVPDIGHRPWAYDVWVSMGNILKKSNKKLEAAQAYQEAVELEPKNPKNKALDLKILELNPSLEVKNHFLDRYWEDMDSAETIKHVLWDLAVEFHTKKLFKEAAHEYARFIKRFPNEKNLDEIWFYYAEASFAASLFQEASQAFQKVRDWPSETKFREAAALNLVYSEAQEIKQTFPDFDFSHIDLAKKAYLSSPIPDLILAYVNAIDVLQQRFKNTAGLPAFLFQTAAINWAYGNMPEAEKRLTELTELYPRQEAAVTALAILTSLRVKEANRLFSESQTPENYRQVAERYLGLIKQETKPEIRNTLVFNAALALERSGQYSAADALFKKTSLTQTAKEQRALYFEQQFLFEKAAALYLADKPDKKDLFRAAFALEAAGQFEKTAQLYERVIREYPDAPEIPDAYWRAGNAYKAAHDSQNENRILLEFQKRYKNQIAKADYLALKPDFENYKKFLINSKSSKEQTTQLTHKAEKLAQLQKSYEELIKKYQLSSWTLASIYQIGSLYEDLFQGLMKAPCPKNIARIDDAACDEYASLLEEKAAVLEKKAIDAYRLVIDKSKSVVDGNDWVLKAKSALYRMKPSEYLPAEALQQEPVVDLGTQAKLPEIVEAARQFYKQNKLAAAAFILEDAPESPLASLWLGHVYQARAEKTKAIAAYEKSDSPEAYENLGLLYLEQGDLGKAELNLKKAAQLLPNLAPAQMHLGNYYFLAKDFKKALEAYQVALELDPKLVAVKLNRGLLEMSEKQYESALADFSSYLQEVKPEAALRAQIESYVQYVTQKIQLEKGHRENPS